jgi:hypothetical protein
MQISCGTTVDANQVAYTWDQSCLPGVKHDAAALKHTGKHWRAKAGRIVDFQRMAACPGDRDPDCF